MTTKEKVARKPKLEPWRAELARIVKFLNKGNEGSQLLCNVLSAFRGPDFTTNADLCKEYTTAVIRQAAELKDDAVHAIVWPDGIDGPQIRKEKITSWHFESHAMGAFIALGLKWDEVNDPR
jgi:hypothetical protein